MPKFKRLGVRVVFVAAVKHPVEMWNLDVLTANLLKDEATVTILIGLTALVLTLCYFRGRSGGKLPPGPVGLPVFGSYFSVAKDPVKKVHELSKKYGNVLGFYMGPQYVVILSDWESTKDALRLDSTLDRPDALFHNVPYKFGVAGSSGPEWVETRRLSSRAIKDIGLNSAGWEDLIKEEVQELVARIVKEGDNLRDARSLFAEHFSNNVVTLILGERLYAGHPVNKQLSEAVDAILDSIPSMHMQNFSPTLSRLLDFLGLGKNLFMPEKVLEFGKFVSDTVDERLRNPDVASEDSFIGRFQTEIQNHKKDGKSSYITVDTLKGNVIALLTGGGETTRTTVIWGLIALADHPDKQRKVHEELDAVIGKDGSFKWEDRTKIPYTYASLLESMRWATIAPFPAFRVASKDTKIQGYHIPKGTFVVSNNWSLHNDPKYWKNPEEFVPERFLSDGGKKVNTSPESFNPFSYGKRNCPGKLLAHMTGLHYYVTILQKFTVAPREGAKVKYEASFGLTYQARNVQMRFIPR